MQSSNFHSTDGIKDRSDEIPLSSGSSVSKSIVTGFIVQVGIFQRPENARNLVSDLQMDGIICLAAIDFVPDEDIPWVLERMFHSARKFVYITVDKTRDSLSLPASSFLLPASILAIMAAASGGA